MVVHVLSPSVINIQVRTGFTPDASLLSFLFFASTDRSAWQQQQQQPNISICAFHRPAPPRLRPDDTLVLQLQEKRKNTQAPIVTVCDSTYKMDRVPVSSKYVNFNWKKVVSIEWSGQFQIGKRKRERETGEMSLVCQTLEEAYQFPSPGEFLNNNNKKMKQTRENLYTWRRLSLPAKPDRHHITSLQVTQ